MKWKNISQQNAAYFVTSVLRNHLPLFENREIVNIVLDSIKFLKQKYNARLLAYVVMPDHIHMVLFMQNETIARIMKDLKSFTSREIYNYLRIKSKDDLVEQLKENTYKGQNYAVWQETYRSEVIYSKKFWKQKVDYIHDNPVRKGFVVNPTDWPYSSAKEWITGEPGVLEIDRVDLGIY